MKDNYTYPAIFDYNEDGVINISFPDFPEAFTCAYTDKEAVNESQDVLALTIKDYEDSGKSVPEINTVVELGQNQKLVYINVWMPFHRSKIKEVYVKKTLTIPEWLNILATQNNINFSAVLVKGLKDSLNIQ
ncbi:MAG: type II toxin-antitoxin system HicB family antitoxin [Lachnospiraceae bacterium]|nr:type II toxin-antitoxin system HicB family antitoxin [Lachnospiraceae bacterium]